MEENLKSQMLSLWLIIVIFLIGYNTPAPSLCVSKSTEVQRKTAPGDIRQSQWGVMPVAACQDTCRLQSAPPAGKLQSADRQIRLQLVTLDWVRLG